MTIDELKAIALFGCSNGDCAVEVSYQQYDLRLIPDTTDPICENCWDEECWVGHRDEEDYEPPRWGDLKPYTPIDDALKEIVAENTRLRAALARSDQPCAYCSLPADEWNKCADGFPGCGRADDALGCPELGAAMERDDLQKAFDLFHDAQNRAVKRWREKHPGNELILPDMADLTEWLLDQIGSDDRS